MNKERLELYTAYLLSTFGYPTTTGLSAMMNGQVSHDQITRFLSEEEYTSKDLWQAVKGTVCQVEREEGVLILDDTVQEKPYTDENEVENLSHIKETLQKDFVCALKVNRLAAVSTEDYHNNRFTSMEDLPWQEESLFTLGRSGYNACNPTTMRRCFHLLSSWVVLFIVLGWGLDFNLSSSSAEADNGWLQKKSQST